MNKDFSWKTERVVIILLLYFFVQTRWLPASWDWKIRFVGSYWSSRWSLEKKKWNRYVFIHRIASCYNYPDIYESIARVHSAIFDICMPGAVSSMNSVWWQTQKSKNCIEYLFFHWSIRHTFYISINPWIIWQGPREMKIFYGIWSMRWKVRSRKDADARGGELNQFGFEASNHILWKKKKKTRGEKNDRFLLIIIFTKDARQ